MTRLGRCKRSMDSALEALRGLQVRGHGHEGAADAVRRAEDLHLHAAPAEHGPRGVARSGDLRCSGWCATVFTHHFQQ